MVLMRIERAGAESIPYRVRIGVTGHRKLDDPAAVEALVKQSIDAEVEGLLPEDARLKMERARRAGTAAISFSVLSSLAEGADRVVARAVLSYPHAHLEAVLPMTLEDYMEDFATEASRKDFAKLLSQCNEPVLLRKRRIRDECSDAYGQEELRKDAYARAGRYVVDHCDVLVAIWDGEPTRDRGGTAEIVEYAQEQNRPVLRVWGDLFYALSRGESIDE
jgi:nucleoside 2-deoxyribosyltransferase